METDSLPRSRHAFLPHERLGKGPLMRTMRREGEKETERRKIGKGGREMKNIRGQGYPKEKRSSNSKVIS